MSAVSQFLGPKACSFDTSCALGSKVFIPPQGLASLICKAGGTAWIVAPNTAEVSRTWYCIQDAITQAQNITGALGWFVPSVGQLQNPGYICRTYWDSFSATFYWSSTECNATFGCIVRFTDGGAFNNPKSGTYCVRAFRAVTY